MKWIAAGVVLLFGLPLLLLAPVLGILVDPFAPWRFAGHGTDIATLPLDGGGASTSTTLRQVLTPDEANTLIVVPGPGRPSQFAVGLSPTDALAACGPVAAIAFAADLGISLTIGRVMVVARQGFWNANVGMFGVTAEQGMMRELGVPSVLEGTVNWRHIQAETTLHRPVILDTPGHYFFLDGYDPASGAYHVGTSGTDLRGGAAWMTPTQIATVPASHGAARAALYAPGG